MKNIIKESLCCYRDVYWSYQGLGQGYWCCHECGKKCEFKEIDWNNKSWYRK